MGGHFRIRIESIRLRETCENFEDLITPLFYLDALITGIGMMGNIKMKSKDMELIPLLITDKLERKRNETIHEYIHDIFECFCQNKQQICLHLESMKRANREMVGLIMNDIKEGEL